MNWKQKQINQKSLQEGNQQQTNQHSSKKQTQNLKCYKHYLTPSQSHQPNPSMSLLLNNECRPIRSNSTDISLFARRQQFHAGIRSQYLSRYFAQIRKQFSEVPTTVSQSQSFTNNRIDQGASVNERSAVLPNNTVMNYEVRQFKDDLNQGESLVRNQSEQVEVRNVEGFLGERMDCQLNPLQPTLVNTFVNPIINNSPPSANFNIQAISQDRLPHLNYHNMNRPTQLMQQQVPFIQPLPFYPQQQSIYQPIQLQLPFSQPQPLSDLNRAFNSSINQLDFTFNQIQNNSFNVVQINNSSIILSPPRPGNQSFTQFLNQLSPPRQQVTVFNQWNAQNSTQLLSSHQVPQSYQVVGNLLSNEKILNQPDYLNPYINYIQERTHQIEQKNIAELLKPDEELHPHTRYQQFQHLQQHHMDKRNEPIITPSISPFNKQKAKPQIRGPLKVEFKQEKVLVEKKEQSKIARIDMKAKVDKIEEKKKPDQEQKCEIKKNIIAQFLKKNKNNPQNNQIKPKNTTKSNNFSQPKWQNPIELQNKKYLNSIIERSNFSNQLRLNLLKTLQLGYQIIKCHSDFVVFNNILGKGTFGSVHLGRNFRTNEKVAVKIIKFKKEKHLLEVKCLKEINHKNIVTLYDYVIEEKEKQCYLFLQYCKENLRQCLFNLNKPYNKQLTQVKTKLNYAQQLVEGMNQLNEKGFIHRDLKFENILIKDNEVVKICDFGLCRKVNKKLQVDSVRCGTPYTMPPQIYFHPRNKDPTYTEKADIFSLAVLLHQLLYNFHPFDYEELHLKNLARIQLQKTHKMSKRFTEEYGLNVQWINKIIEGGLKNVEERMSWEDVMKVFMKRLNKLVVEQTKDEQVEVKRNFSKKQLSPNVIILTKEDSQKVKKPVIQTKLHIINQKKAECIQNQPNKHKQNKQTNIPNNSQNSYRESKLQNSQQKHADFIEEAKRIFSKQGIIMEKQKQKNISSVKNNKDVIQRKEEISQLGHLQNLRRLRELRPRMSEKEAKPLLDMNKQAFVVEVENSTMSNKNIVEDGIQTYQISLKKLFIFLLLLAVIIMGAQMICFDQDPTIIPSEMKIPVQ